jgi:hypothetical protein
LRGRNKTLCLGVADQAEVFNKCKELALQQEELKQHIKEHTDQVAKCKEEEDKKCVKDLRLTIKSLKELRDSVVKDFKELVNLLDD